MLDEFSLPIPNPKPQHLSAFRVALFGQAQTVVRAASQVITSAKIFSLK